MTFDLESVLKLSNTFGNLPPLTEAQKEDRRIFEAKAFDKENFQNACRELSKKL